MSPESPQADDLIRTISSKHYKHDFGPWKASYLESSKMTYKIRYKSNGIPFLASSSINDKC
jgi:hypothetical protein